MSIYQTFNSNLPNYDTPDPNYDLSGNGPSLNSRDIDKDIVYTENGNNFYDYDVTINPTTSGPDIQAPIQTGKLFDMNDLNVGSESDSLGSRIDLVNNGRVGDINIIKDISENPDELYINKDNKINSIKGIIENTSVNEIFFSDMNTELVQQTIRYKVYQATDKVISNQSENVLFIIMCGFLGN